MSKIDLKIEKIRDDVGKIRGECRKLTEEMNRLDCYLAEKTFEACAGSCTTILVALAHAKKKYAEERNPADGGRE